jgi:hypothetical protein
MRAVPFNPGPNSRHLARQESGDGILKLPSRLRRELILLFMVKLAMLGVLYQLFFSPSHRPAIDTVAHIAGQQRP